MGHETSTAAAQGWARTRKRSTRTCKLLTPCKVEKHQLWPKMRLSLSGAKSEEVCSLPGCSRATRNFLDSHVTPQL